jgi:hypothetical protein
MQDPSHVQVTIDGEPVGSMLDLLETNLETLPLETIETLRTLPVGGSLLVGLQRIERTK